MRIKVTAVNGYQLDIDENGNILGYLYEEDDDNEIVKPWAYQDVYVISQEDKRDNAGRNTQSGSTGKSADTERNSGSVNSTEKSQTGVSSEASTERDNSNSGSNKNGKTSDRSVTEQKSGSTSGH